MQKLNSNTALGNPVTTPLSALSSPQQTCSLCRGQHQWSGRGEAPVFYKNPPKWWPKGPLNCGSGDTLSSRLLMDQQLCVVNGPWWILIHWRSLANFMIIMARKWRKRERSGWGVDKQKRSTAMGTWSTWAERKNKNWQFRDHLRGSAMEWFMCVKTELNLKCCECSCI